MMSYFAIDMSYKIEVKTKKKRENFLPAHAARKCPLNRLVRYSKCPLNRDNTVHRRRLTVDNSIFVQ
jgi:hypothetical protein